MPACLSRARLVPTGLAGLAALLVFIGGLSTRGQDRPATAPDALPKDVLPFGPALMLPTEPGLAKKLQAVRDYAAAREWDNAGRLLQDLLDRPEDVFLSTSRPGPEGKEITSFLSVRAEANRLLAGLPPAGREAYETLAGRTARQALGEANGEPAAIARIAQRYAHTRAGTEALARLAAYHLDRGHFDLAAGYFDRLLHGSEPAQPLMLFQAALAFRRAGYPERAEQAWKRLTAAAPDGLTVGDRTISLADLEKTLNRPARVEPAADDSLAVSPWPPGTLSDATAEAWLADAVQRKEASEQPVLPANTPIVAGGLVVERTDRGLRAVDRRTGLTAWEAPSALALAYLLRDPASHAHVASWMEAYLASQPGVPLENTLLGTLSTDGRRVYAVDDLPVPPRPSNYAAFHANRGQGLKLVDAPELTEAVFRNQLLALDARSGQVVWEFGGRVRDCAILGPPLALGGQLYAAMQVGHDLRLVCLEPLTGRVAWTQTLATFAATLALDGGRRLHAVRLAYADGLLICPTHAGGVLAFDLVARSLAWAHAYRVEAPPPDPSPFMGRGRGRRSRGVFVTEPPNLTSHWPVTVPFIAHGKVVLGATDTPALLCLDLRTGSAAWQRERGSSDLFVAGIADDRVLVVGKGEVRALSLADGKPLWQCGTPLPCGRGAIAGRLYGLPVRNAAGQTEVLAIELAKGTIEARTAPPRRAVVEQLPYPDGFVAPVPDRSARRIAGLVRQLGSERPAQRESATQALESIAGPALPALHQLLGSQDPEVRRRAALLVRTIETRLDTAELLQAQPVRLHYTNTPLSEAALDFAKKTGVTLKLPSDAAKASDRKITLDTGPVPFWQALDQFCAQAGLVETAPPASPTAGGNTTTFSSIVVVGGAAARRATDILRRDSDDKPVELILAEGKPAPQPTSLAGKLRVRLAPPDAPLPHQRKEDGDLLFALEVAASGGLQWQKAVGLRVERALDEDGRALPQLATSFRLPTPAAAGRGSVFVNGMPINPPGEELEGPAARLVPVRLRPAAERPVRKLRELAGTIVAQVRTPREPQISVTDVLKSAGKVVKGRHGGEVKVLEVVREDDGLIRLKVLVEGVARGLTDMPANPFGGTVIINGRRLGDEDLLSSLNFALLDDRGQPFQVVKATSTGLRAGAAHEYELVYEPAAGTGPAAKFVYADWRTLFIDVPFRLKNVPMP